MNSVLCETLTLLQRQSGLHETQTLETGQDGIANDLDAITYQGHIIDTPLVPTRAALYIYLNAMVGNLFTVMCKKSDVDAKLSSWDDLL